MNILFLTPRDSRKNLGGVEKHVRILTEELERRGHRVKELALNDVASIASPGTSRYLASLDSSTRRRLLARNDRFFKFKAWMYLWKKRDLVRWAEVVHVHDVLWWWLPFGVMNWFPQYYAYLLPWSVSTRRKSASTGYGRTSGFFQRKNPGPSVFTTFHGWEGVCPPTRSAVWQKKLAQKLSRGTIGVGSFYEKWYGVKPDRIVWGAVDPETDGLYKGPTLPWQGRTLRKIIFLGRLEKVNGIEVVVEAIRKLEHIKARPFSERPGLFRYIFVGNGSYRRQAEKFGKVTGMVKNPEKYLADADVVITSSYMSMLEAAARAKPIIAIANSELKEDYLDGHPLRKYIKVVKSADELYKGLTLGNQGETLKDLRVAKAWAKSQTPKKLADEYEKLWRNVNKSLRS